MKMLITIIVPVFNEEANIELLYQEIQRIIQPLTQYDFEFIFVNDGSRDRSWDILIKLSAQDARIKAISFTRNFGHQMALTAGYDHARGDAIITMDCDMQDTPQLIIPMLQEWSRGTAIVYARRIDRKDTVIKRLTANLYYRLLDTIADVKIPRNVGDFRLIDRQVLATLKNCHERSRYLRGMVAWTGFPHAFVDFKRPDRHAGQTGYTWKKMYTLAFDGITSFSLFPLKLAAYSGFFVIISGAGMFAYISYDAIINQTSYPLFKWLVTILYIFMGVQFILMWLLGEYIGRIYDQEKGRPLYIVGKTKNCD